MEAKSKTRNDKKITAKSDNYKPNVGYTKPESLTDITRRQLLTKDTSIRPTETKSKLRLPNNVLSGASNFSGTGIPTTENQKNARKFEEENPKTAAAISALIPFGTGSIAGGLLRYGGKEVIKQGTKQIVKEGVKQGLKKNTKNLVTSGKFGRTKGFRQNPLQNSNK
jgi:hypothetical protein